MVFPVYGILATEGIDLEKWVADVRIERLKKQGRISDTNILWYHFKYSPGLLKLLPHNLGLQGNLHTRRVLFLVLESAKYLFTESLARPLHLL